MRNQKRDANEGDIIAALKCRACSVDQLPGGNGRPDLLVYDPRSKSLFLVEVKVPFKKLNSLQKTWHAEWGGPVHLVWGPEQALEVLSFYREK